MLRRDGGAKEGTLSSKLTAFKKVIDGCVFVKPRQIPIEVADNKLLVVKRPLRVDTPKGSRVAIATSEAVPAGSRIAFRMVIIGQTVSEALLREWFEYGQLRGLGQWRNGGFGSFEVKRFEKV